MLIITDHVVNEYNIDEERLRSGEMTLDEDELWRVSIRQNLFDFTESFTMRLAWKSLPSVYCVHQQCIAFLGRVCLFGNSTEYILVMYEISRNSLFHFTRHRLWCG